MGNVETETESAASSEDGAVPAPEIVVAPVPMTAEEYLRSPERGVNMAAAAGLDSAVPPVASTVTAQKSPSDEDGEVPTAGKVMKPGRLVKVDLHGDGRLWEVPGAVAKRLGFLNKELKSARAKPAEAPPVAPNTAAPPAVSAAQPEEAPQDLDSWAASAGIPIPTAFDDAAFKAQVAETDAFFGAQGKLVELFEAQEKRLAARGYVDGRTILSKFAVPLTEYVNSTNQRLESVMPVVLPQRDRGYVSGALKDLGFDDKLDVGDVTERIEVLREYLKSQGRNKADLEGRQFIDYAVHRVIADIARERWDGQDGEEEAPSPPRLPAAPRHVAPHPAPSRMSGADRTPSNGSANRHQHGSIDPGKALRTFLTTGVVPN